MAKHKNGGVLPSGYTPFSGAGSPTAQAEGAAPADAPKKTICPITRAQFQGAKVLGCNLDGKPFAVPPKEFSTGSFGWHCGDKAEIEVDGVKVRCQVNIMLTVIGSKEAKADLLS